MLKIFLTLGLILFQIAPAGVVSADWDYIADAGDQSARNNTVSEVTSEPTVLNDIAWDDQEEDQGTTTDPGASQTLVLTQNPVSELPWDDEMETETPWDFNDTGGESVIGDGSESPWDYDVETEQIPWDDTEDKTGTSQVATASINITSLVGLIANPNVFADSVTAKPGDLLAFKIQVKAGGTDLSGVTVKNALPDKLTYIGNLSMNGVSLSGDITKGVNIGNIAANQTKTIVFHARVAEAGKFSFGKTKLTNTAMAYNDKVKSSDASQVTVNKEGTVSGATNIPTGFTNNIFFDSFFLPLLLTLMMIWIFKSNILRLEEWMDERKKQLREYKNRKMLQAKIAKIRIREVLNR
ncbi:MAG: hypothetical protein PHW72_01325 [Candidatus Pacebacteria bacterium]|nr:hypothetical protein [Candidatus Paceibacterota bacterium]